MTTIARIRTHPTDPEAVIVDVPREFNSSMAKFAPAVLAREHHGFVMLVEHLTALATFAARTGLHLVDERARSAGARTLMPECQHCGQPARLTKQPDHCPSCGKRWVAHFEEGLSTKFVETECVTCGRRQRGQFRHCAHCGGPMDPEPNTRAMALPRVRLENPVPIAECIAETFPDATPKPESGDW